jgi:hypothetical protein
MAEEMAVLLKGAPGQPISEDGGAGRRYIRVGVALPGLSRSTLTKRPCRKGIRFLIGVKWIGPEVGSRDAQPSERCL